MNGQPWFSVGHSATMFSKATSSTQGRKHRENAVIKADSSLVTNTFKETNDLVHKAVRVNTLLLASEASAFYRWHTTVPISHKFCSYCNIFCHSSTPKCVSSIDTYNPMHIYLCYENIASLYTFDTERTQSLLWGSTMTYPRHGGTTFACTRTMTLWDEWRQAYRKWNHTRATLHLCHCNHIDAFQVIRRGGKQLLRYV